MPTAGIIQEKRIGTSYFQINNSLYEVLGNVIRNADNSKVF